MNKAQEFIKEVIKLSQKYELPFFIVTDGASATSNTYCESVKVARMNHIKWETENGIDYKHDWNKEEVKNES